jgi:hypothetical protein
VQQAWPLQIDDSGRLRRGSLQSRVPTIGEIRRGFVDRRTAGRDILRMAGGSSRGPRRALANKVSSIRKQEIER